jgi:hypothetical protein
MQAPWKDLLDPEAFMHCISCHCPYDASDEPRGPFEGCADEACPCHATYWLTVPELQKRKVWGDR